MIQDIYPHRFSLDYQVCAPREGDPVIIFQDNQVFLRRIIHIPFMGKRSQKAKGKDRTSFCFP